MIGGYGQQQMYGQPQQTGGLISVRNELEARNYPTAHGASLTFKDENAPYLYTKTLGFSQMDVPVFEKFRLEKVADSPQNEPTATEAGKYTLNDLKAEIDRLRAQIDTLKKDIEILMSFKAEFGGDGDVE